MGPPQFLADYLAAERTLGRIRPDVQEQPAAITMLAMLFGLAMLPPDADGYPPAPMVDSAVQLIIQGLAPTPRA